MDIGTPIRKINSNSPNGADQVTGASPATNPGQDANQDTGENSSIVYGEIIAWRVWEVRGDELWPYAVYGHGPWVPGTNTASYPPTIGAGHGRCAGFYAKKKKFELLMWCGDNEVVGRCAMWGDVVLCSEGYRAEFARVHSLDGGLSWWKRRRIAKKYGAKVGYYPTFLKIIRMPLYAIFTLMSLGFADLILHLFDIGPLPFFFGG